MNDIKKYLQPHSSETIGLKGIKKIEALIKSIENLSSIVKFCSEESYFNFLKENTFENLLKDFIDFWYNGMNLLLEVDSHYFLNICILLKANKEDLKWIRQKFNSQNLAEKMKEIVTIEEDLNNFDPSELNIQKILLKTQFSTIFLATQGERSYQFEIFDPQILDDTSFYTNYVKTLKSAEHFNVLRLKSSTSIYPYCLIYEYCENGTLYDKLRDEENPLTATQKSIIILDVARALEFFHSRKIVNRYISPSVIFLDKNMNAKVGGFWFSSPSYEDKYGVFYFSPYLAPELMMDNKAYHSSIDVYSLVLLIWELFSNKTPYQNMTPSYARRCILGKDIRPNLIDDISLINFFLCGWSRDPSNRPSANEIIKLIQSDRLIFKDTNNEEFNNYVKSTAKDHSSALKGILYMTNEQLNGIISKNVIDDESLGIIMNVYTDSENSKLRKIAKHALIKELNKERELSIHALILYVELTSHIPKIQVKVHEKCKYLSDEQYDTFLDRLFEEVEPKLAISFAISIKLNIPKETKKILDFGITQPDEIASFAAETILMSSRTRMLIFDYVQKSNVYYIKALNFLIAFDKSSLEKHVNLILLFIDKSTEGTLKLIDSIVNRLNPLTIDFDPECKLFIKLAKEGFIDTVLRFAKSPIYAKRFAEIILPQLINRYPVNSLLLILRFIKFDNLKEIYLQYNIIRLITLSISSGEYEIASQAALKIDFPRGMLKRNISETTTLVKYLSECESEQAASCILTTLLPFALYSKWTDKTIVPNATSKMIQSDDTLVASRALSLAVVLVQNSEIARIMAIPMNIAAVSRFFDCAPPPFLYISARFLAGIAPYLRMNEIVQEAVSKEIEVALMDNTNERLITVIAQSFYLLPGGDDWKTIKLNCPIHSFIEKFSEKYSSGEIYNLIQLLKMKS